MKLAIDVKNVPKAMTPSKDNVIIYDGKQWYITTKQELFKEYDEHFARVVAECEEKIAEMNALKVNLAEQMLSYGEIIRDFVSKESK